MTIKEQIAAFDELIDFIENQLPVYAERIAANDLAALVAGRVINKGENFRGAAFSAYSNNPVSAFRFVAKSRTQSADRKIRTIARAKGALSYTGFRQLNNLRTNKKNFEFTGEMWKKFGVVTFSTSGNTFKATIGGQTPAAQLKIDENSAREGVSIVEASETEEALITRTTQKWLDGQADRILNG